MSDITREETKKLIQAALDEKGLARLSGMFTAEHNVPRGTHKAIVITPTTHVHPESEVTNLVTDLAGKAASTHEHAESDVTGLVADLAGKAAASHAHAGTDITSGTIDGDRLPALSATKKGGAPATGTPSGKFLKDNDTWDTPAGGDGVTMKIAAGTPVTINNATQKTTTSLTYVKVKEMKVNEAWTGSWRCGFTIVGDSSHLAYGQVYVNGVVKGAEHSSFEPGGEGFTDDITLDLAVNDLIQIYAHMVTGGTCAIQGMTLQYQWNIKAIGGKTLVTALPTTDTTVISVTNQDP